ncbi:SIMPL domain-containing protein [Novosphingobium sp. KCTC 2891]|uniref:SIMPL domain-containing protein n=1 Tax=Novosphingobium sp. KCTC 2891 TaxID=2989730 RepID=UPI0022220991|nr:SIMPL domain-containing protein [Novosphingobium sp. KCTC 2891]MCW1384459.1 SIMPL domain-containing protein [Novosphingobium sp. KCTC 2891]
MKRLILASALAALPLAALPFTAHAQQASSGPVVAAGNAMLTVSADGRSTRAPDLAVFNGGVTTQAKTASAALTENAAKMNAVIVALKKAGIADRDIQTSNLSVNPVYGQPRRLPDGSVENEPVIIGYQATNQVQVRQRKLDQYGKVIDTLVTSGANQVNGPSFQLDDSDAAMDEARVEAMKKVRARADLYARAAGLRVVRVLTISESGGWSPQPVMFARAEKMMDAAPPAPSPVAAGELEIRANVTVTYELAP